MNRSTGEGACLLGRSWGYDQQGIWVSDGCSGEFLLGQRVPTDAAEPRGVGSASASPGGKPDAPAEEAESAESKVLRNPERPTWGALDSSGLGIRLYSSDIGEVALSAYALVRYIDQRPEEQGFVDHLGNERPQLLLCLHEESAVAIAHGYAKVTGRAMAAAVHSNVGLFHAAMAIFNAWCDRMPVLVIGATGPVDAARRRPWIDWIHTARDQGAIVRGYTKWDDQPASPAAAREAVARAFWLAGTLPQALLMMNGELIDRATSLEPGSELARIFSEGANSDADRIQQVCLAALSRRPTDAEVDRLRDLIRARVRQQINAQVPAAQARQEALRDVPARAAVLPGPGVGEPALAVERLLPLDVVVLVVVLAGEGLGLRGGRQIGAREGADFVGECLVLGFQVQVHASSVVPTGARSAERRDLVLDRRSEKQVPRLRRAARSFARDDGAVVVIKAPAPSCR